MFESAAEALFSLTDIQSKEQSSEIMPALINESSSNVSRSQRFCISLGPGPRWCS